MLGVDLINSVNRCDPDAVGVESDQSRILLQQIHVERIPLQEVQYRYAGQDQRLWICGNEKAVYAPNAPWNRSRLALLIGGLALGAALAIAILVYLLAF